MKIYRHCYLFARATVILRELGEASSGIQQMAGHAHHRLTASA